jgi:prepilin-type N-terminal cleavage/methylation domain-containing protein
MCQKRRGFTLVEMLVATALIIFIMVILTQAFTAGMDAFLKLKTIGDMEERLRTAATILRQDLAADHFEGRKRLSDSNFWNYGPPREGFFRIWQGGACVTEGGPKVVDGDGLPSLRATDHYLHFTVKRRGNRREQFALARVPPGSPLLALGQPDSRFQDPVNGPYASQWSEVAYFLKDSGEQTPADPVTGPAKRYNLYRRQLLVVPDNSALNWPPKVDNSLYSSYTEVSCKPGAKGLYFNSPSDLTVPQRRFGMRSLQDTSPPLPPPPGPPNPFNNGGWPTEADLSYPVIQNAALVGPGADLLLTDVISFNVRVMLAGQSDFEDLPESPDNPLFRKPSQVRVFDTWSSAIVDTFDPDPTKAHYDYSHWNPLNSSDKGPTLIPLYKVGSSQIRITALEITLRVWDPKSRQARQITVIQDM